MIRLIPWGCLASRMNSSHLFVSDYTAIYLNFVLLFLGALNQLLALRYVHRAGVVASADEFLPANAANRGTLL